MDTDTVKSDEQAVPTVIAKKRKQEGDKPATVEEQNAAEIARLTAWATGDCGKPILAD